MNNLPAVAIDFETTDASKDAQATELGLCPVDFSRNDTLNPRIDAAAVRCKPERTITYGAMAVTGICPEDVANAPSHQEVCHAYLPQGAAYIVGHNVDFDIQVAANAGVDVSQYRAICTLAIARELYPELEHSLGALMYALDYDYARQHAQHAHSAAHDVRFCVRLLRIFCRALGISDMAKLYEYSQQARIPKRFSFGKHKGEVIAEVAQTPKGRDYLKWLLKNNEDPYLLQACQQLLEAHERK